MFLKLFSQKDQQKKTILNVNILLTIVKILIANNNKPNVEGNHVRIAT